MEEHFKTIAQTSVRWWDLKNTLSRSTIEATDFWLDRANNIVSAEQLTIEPTARDAWLRKSTNDQGHALVGRFVWLSVDSVSLEVNLTKLVEDVILKDFGLEGAHAYLRSMLSDVTELTSTQTSTMQTFAFCYGPKVAAIWSHKAAVQQPNAPAVTLAVLFTRAVRGGNRRKDPPQQPKDPLHQQKRYQAVLKSVSWSHHAFVTPFFPAYALSLLLNHEIGVKHMEIEKAVKKMEAGTGFHDFDDRHADLTISQQETEVEKLVKLASDTSGYVNRIASTIRKTRMLEMLLEFMGKAAASENLGAPGQSPTPRSQGVSFIGRYANLMKARLAMHDTELASLEKRIQVQKDMLFSTISQYDTLSTFTLARESNRVAEASREIAAYSYRDASSMKTLAIVTMLFLPGSFISSLFSSQLFDWDSVDKSDEGTIGVKPTPQWKLYWAVTVPLTVVVFSIYLVGYYMVRKWHLQMLEMGRGGAASSKAARDGSGIAMTPVASFRPGATVRQSMMYRIKQEPQV